MVHPSEILRSDSEEGSYFSAPTNAAANRPIDCGISTLPCLTSWCNLEKCAKPGVFMCIISLLGLFEGSAYAYFRGTASSWMQHYNFSQTTVDWLLYFDDIFIGILAFIIAYWGNRIHRASWLGGLTIFQSIASALLIITETHRKSFFSHNITSEIQLCAKGGAPRNLLDTEINYTAIVLLYVYQLSYAMAIVSLITHGLTYLDDNIMKKKNSAAYLCTVLATFEIGKQLGMYSTWITFNHFLPNIFLTPVWLLFSSLLFVIGVMVTMFPYELPSVVMSKMVESILVLANGEEEEELEKYSEEFWTSFLRLLKNKILMVNVYASLFMHSAIINFNVVQTQYYQSRFFVYISKDESGYQDSWLAQILTNLMKQPFVTLSIVSTGMIIAKLRPSATKLAIFNVAIAVTVLTLYAIYGFLQCDTEIKSEFGGKLTSTFCQSQCSCSEDIIFSPVCTMDGQNTYFSPCHAGCAKINAINGIYEDCSCGVDVKIKTNTTARSGSCNSDNCTLLWSLAQVNGVTIAAMYATTTVTNLLISLRCVYKSDKALSLALEATLVGILPYIPLRLIFSIFEDYFCIFRTSDGTCKLHSIHFGTFVTSMTVGLMSISIVLYVVVIFLVKDLSLYEEAKSGSSRLSPLPRRPTNNRERQTINESAASPNETDTMLTAQPEVVNTTLQRPDDRILESAF